MFVLQGMFSITSLGLIMVCVASWMAHLRGGLTSNGKLAPHASVSGQVGSGLLGVVRMLLVQAWAGAGCWA